MSFTNSELARFYGMSRQTFIEWRKSPSEKVKLKLAALEMYYGAVKNGTQVQSVEVEELKSISQKLNNVILNIGGDK